MGLYVNPKSESKEAFLTKNAVPISKERFLQEPATDQTHLAWVDNGPFTALAIGFSLRERQAFCHPDDTRPRRYYTCPTAALTEEQGLPKNWVELVKQDQERGMY